MYVNFNFKIEQSIYLLFYYITVYCTLVKITDTGLLRGN